jgi:hypothetical protein
VDLSLHKPTTNLRKRLMRGALFETPKLTAKPVMDVNKAGELQDGLL